MAEGTALDQQAVEKAHELAQAVYLPAVRAIRKAMDYLQMTYEAKNPIQGEASHKVLAYEVCVAAFAALADAGYSVVKTERLDHGYRVENGNVYLASPEAARHVKSSSRAVTIVQRVVGPWEPVPEGGDQ